MTTRAIVFVGAMAAAGCGAQHVASSAATLCDRSCLKGVLDSYLDAMITHDASRLPTSASLRFTENGSAKKIGEGLWTTAEAITYRLDAVDPQGGQVATEAVVKENGELAHLLVRLKMDGNTISEAETIICRKGQIDLFGPEKLTAPPPLYTDLVPAAERVQRDQLKAAADAYFTAVQTEGTSDYKPAPLAADANRFENGIQTTNVAFAGLPAASASEQLDKGFYKNLSITDRRFPVLDEEHGIALGIMLMHVRDANTVLIAEMFKISGGRIRQIQAVMVGNPNGAPTGWN